MWLNQRQLWPHIQTATDIICSIALSKNAHYSLSSYSQTNTFQGIVITDGNKTYAVYTYHCDDVQWSDGSVIGFNAGGSYYKNHPLSDSLAARDIDCVHSPGSEWNNVVYDVNPNGTVTIVPPASTS